MKQQREQCRQIRLPTLVALFIIVTATASAQDAGPKASSYAPVDSKETFVTIMTRMKTAKPAQAGCSLSSWAHTRIVERGKNS